MQHRHLNHNHLSLAAIDDVICRGGKEDWAVLGRALLDDTQVLERVQQLCRPHVADGYAQRYHFWMNYAQAHRTTA